MKNSAAVAGSRPVRRLQRHATARQGGARAAELIAAPAIDQIVADEVEPDDLGHLKHLVVALRQAGELHRTDEASLATANDQAERAHRYGDTYRAAAFCLVGRTA